MARIDICKTCKKEFKRWGKPRKGSAYKFCSRKCYWQSMRIPIFCNMCKKEFKRKSNGISKYCSLQCQKEGKWGEKNKVLNVGRKHTKEHIEKMLTSMRRKFLSKEPTSIEKTLYDYLLLKGILFERQKVVGNRFIVDAYIPSLNLIIEADGNYWHNREDNKIKDKRKNEYLRNEGFKLLRLTETEINNGSFKERLVI